jgi:hypothetical protein
MEESWISSLEQTKQLAQLVPDQKEIAQGPSTAGKTALTAYAVF